MARGPEEMNKSTIACGPTTLVKNHYSVPVEWVNLHELNDEFAIFKAWPSEQDRVAATRLPARARAQVGEGGGRQPLPPRVRAGLRTPASR